MFQIFVGAITSLLKHALAFSLMLVLAKRLTHVLSDGFTIIHFRKVGLDGKKVTKMEGSPQQESTHLEFNLCLFVAWNMHMIAWIGLQTFESLAFSPKDLSNALATPKLHLWALGES